MLASKQHPQVSKHFKICGKTFAVQAKTMKVLALKRFIPHGTFEMVVRQDHETKSREERARRPRWRWSDILF